MLRLLRPSRLTALAFSAAACTALLGCPADPAKTTPANEGAPSAPAVAPTAPLVPKREVADWCPEHGVPESVCTRCNEALVPEFKAKGDWCAAHTVPESHCFTCNPEREADFKAKAPQGT